jgi:hypothetical protein
MIAGLCVSTLCWNRASFGLFRSIDRWSLAACDSSPAPTRSRDDRREDREPACDLRATTGSSASDAQLTAHRLEHGLLSEMFLGMFPDRTCVDVRLVPTVICIRPLERICTKLVREPSPTSPAARGRRDGIMDENCVLDISHCLSSRHASAKLRESGDLTPAICVPRGRQVSRHGWAEAGATSGGCRGVRPGQQATIELE